MYIYNFFNKMMSLSIERNNILNFKSNINILINYINYKENKILAINQELSDTYNLLFNTLINDDKENIILLEQQIILLEQQKKSLTESNKLLLINSNKKIIELNILLENKIKIYTDNVQQIINKDINFNKQILHNIGIIVSNLTIKKIRYYETFPLEYLDLTTNPIINFSKSKSKYHSSYNISYKIIQNSNIINITSNNFNRTFNYFLQSLVINILLLNDNIFIGGGYVTNLFVKDIISYIDLDIYIDLNNYNLLITTFYDFIARDNKQLYNSFYLIVSELSKLILGEEIKLKDIYTYKNLTQNINTRCMKMVFEKYNDIELSLDINYISPHQYHLSDIKKNNYDFITNTLQLYISNNKLEIKISPDCLNEYSIQKLKIFNTLNYGIIGNIQKNNSSINDIKYRNNINISNISNIEKKIDHILNLCNEYIDDTTKIIHMIIQKQTFLCHNICTDDTGCDHYNCDICLQIKKKMYRRYKKFSIKYNIILETCNKKFCICNGIKELIELEKIKLNNDIDSDITLLKNNNKDYYSHYKHYPIIY